MKKIITILTVISMQCCGAKEQPAPQVPLPKAHTTYYISSKGSEKNDGLSPNTPWPITKVTSYFPNGTRFLFKRGDTLYGRIATTGNIDQSVTTADTLVYDAYGTGAKPIITTRKMLEGWNLAANWKKTKYPNVWQMELSYVHNAYPRIFLNKGGGFYEATKAENAAGVSAGHVAAFANVGPPQLLYLYSATNPATAFTAIEYPSGTSNTLSIANQINVVVRNLDIRGSSGSTVDVEFSKDVVIENCNIGWDAAHSAVRLNHAKRLVFRNSVMDSGDRLEDSFSYQQGVGDGFYIGSGCEDIEVAKNTLKDWGHSLVEITNEGKTDSIKNIFIRDNYMTAPDVDYCRALGVNVNFGKNIVVERNLMESFPVQNQVTADNCFTFSYNIVNNVTQVNHYTTGTGIGLYIGGYSGYYPRGMRIVNNIFANCSTAGIQLAGYPDTSTTAVFTPSAPLLPNTTYTATVTTGVKSAEGKAIPNSFVWRFTTGSSIGSAPSTVGTTPVVTTFPANGATGVPLNTTVKVTFPEGMDNETINTTTFLLKQGANVIRGTVQYPPRYRPATRNLIANNVFYNNGSNPRNPPYAPQMFQKGIQLIIENNPDVQDNVYQNNLFYSSLTSQVIRYGHDPDHKFLKTVSEFNSRTGTATRNGRKDVIGHNIQGDPGFKNNKFEPGKNSPCIGNGISLPANGNEGLLPGSTWPNAILVGRQGSRWNIGAYVGGGK